MQRYKLLVKNFKEQRADSDKFGFPEFMKLFNQYTDMPFQTKLELFRDCFSVSRGDITP